MADLELAAGKRGRDAATVLQWAGISLLGIFLTLLVSSAWPLALLKPAWLQKMSDIVQNLGVNALMGAVLLVLAQLLNPKEVALEQRVRLVRRLGFLGRDRLRASHPPAGLFGGHAAAGAHAAGKP